jgi:hypothetical protein
MKLILVIRITSGLVKDKLAKMGYNFEMYYQNILPKWSTKCATKVKTLKNKLIKNSYNIDNYV